MTLKLYVGSKRYSSWSLRPYVALAQSGLAFETTTIMLDRDNTKSEIAKLTPSGKVPVLVDGDLIVWDSLAICEYVAELAPEAGLWPADRADRARARALCAEMHAGFAALRRDMSMDVLSDRRGQGHTPEALADARRVMAMWNEAIANSGGPFLFGKQSIADAFYAPVTLRFTIYGVELDPVTRAYVHAVQALPSMKTWQHDALAEAPSR